MLSKVDMTKKEILEQLTDNNKVIEVIECDRSGRTIYKVNVYSKGFISRFFGLFQKINIKKTTYPFFFETKELVEEFMSYYPELFYRYGSYWDGDNISCLLLDTSYSKNNYYMVDSFKEKGYSGCKQNDKYYVETNGVWGGTVCLDGKYHTYSSKCMYYTKIFELEGRTMVKKHGTTYYLLTPKEE